MASVDHVKMHLPRARVESCCATTTGTYCKRLAREDGQDEAGGSLVNVAVVVHLGTVK